MISVETTQGKVTVDVPEIYTKIGVKISGGADSAIVAYMLALYKKRVRDIDLIPVTVINSLKPHQHIFAKRVLDFIEAELDVKFEPHCVDPVPVDPENYSEGQSKYVRSLRRAGLFEKHFTGITENPDEVLDTDYMGDETRAKSLGVKPYEDLYSFHPLINVNKRAVAEIYRHYGLMDTLFPITRSCENSKIRFTEPHCGECWWCLERKWGFERLS